MHYGYSPLNKPLKEVTPKDLLLLKEIEEGWYIDYKSSPYKDSADFGKHMSSFANQYGGFIFVGVEENQKTNRAEKFIGFDTSDVNKILERIRAAATTNVNPELYYESHVIHGPIEEIQLAEGKSIIIVGVPEGMYPPYIHSSGKIYQRFSDSSKPFDVKEIKDRHSLDKLFERKAKSDSKIVSFINDKFCIPEEQAHVPRFEISLLCNLDKMDSNICITYELLQKVIQNKKLQLDVSIDSLYQIRNGFFMRIVQNNKAELHLPSMFLSPKGNAKITFPLNIPSQKEFIRIYENKNLDSSRESCVSFHEQLSKEQYDNVKIVDYSMLPVLLMNFLFILQEALNKQNEENDVTLYYSLYLENIANTVGFYHFKDTYNKGDRKLPFFPFKSIQIPTEIYFDTLEKIIFNKQKTNNYLEASIRIIVKLFMRLGIIRNEGDVSIFEDALLATGIK